MSRTDRIRHIDRLVEAAQLKYGVNEARGIAVDADSGETGFDLRWVHGTAVPTSEIERIATAIFGASIETYTANPFGEARAYTPPE